MPRATTETSAHRRLTNRLGAFLGALLDDDHPDLAYVQLDSACGRPVFARGAGIATAPDWFAPCTFSLGCPLSLSGDDPARLTYPC